MMVREADGREASPIYSWDLRDALRRIGKWTVEIIKPSDSVKGLEVLPRRRVAERTLAQLSRNRRLARTLGKPSRPPLVVLYPIHPAIRWPHRKALTSMPAI